MKRARLFCKQMAVIVFLVYAVFMVFLCSPTQAVPSFTRQTGLKCNVCHSNPPELTAFGRKFKLEGYTLVDPQPDLTIVDKDLKIRRDFPLSVMLVLSGSHTRTDVAGVQNDNVEFPQALSVFLAGQVASRLGGMTQVTYSHDADRFSLDNTDIRYATHTTLGTHDVLYGLTLNNSPTVEDVWNSTPSWGFPWLSSNTAPSPGAQPLEFGALAQDVAGLGAYTLWNEHLYAAFTVYRSEHAGGAQPADGRGFQFNIHGVAPYWRLAWQQTWGLNYLEVGTHGLYVSSIPDTIAGLHDAYRAPAFDLQYERPFGVNLLSAHALYVRERSQLDATMAAGGAATSGHDLNTLRADATLHLRSRYVVTLGGFSTTGTADSILFAAAPVSGSRSGSPNSSGWMAQAGYWPVENVELSVAYTAYATFNGARHDYDGLGRSASANNSVYVALWLNF